MIKEIPRSTLPGVLMLIVLTAASVLAYGPEGVTAGVGAVASHATRATEPGALLLSGTALLAAAGLLRRLTI